MQVIKSAVLYRIVHSHLYTFPRDPWKHNKPPQTTTKPPQTTSNQAPHIQTSTHTPHHITYPLTNFNKARLVQITKISCICPKSKVQIYIQCIHHRYFYILTCMQAGRQADRQINTYAHILMRPLIAALFHLSIYRDSQYISLVLMAYAMAQMSMRICRVSLKDLSARMHKVWSGCR